MKPSLVEIVSETTETVRYRLDGVETGTFEMGRMCFLGQLYTGEFVMRNTGKAGGKIASLFSFGRFVDQDERQAIEQACRKAGGQGPRWIEGDYPDDGPVLGWYCYENQERAIAAAVAMERRLPSYRPKQTPGQDTPGDRP